MQIDENLSEQNFQKLSEEGLGDAQQDVLNQAITGSKYDEQEEVKEQTYDSQSDEDEIIDSKKQIEIIETYNQFQQTNFIPEIPKLNKKQQIIMLNQFRIDTGNFLKDEKAFIKPGKSGKHKKHVSTAPHQNRAEEGTRLQGQSSNDHSDHDFQYEEIKSSLQQNSVIESTQLNSYKNSPLTQNSAQIHNETQKVPLQAPVARGNTNILRDQNRISKSKQEKISEQSPREQIKKQQRSTTKELAPIIPLNKQLDHPNKKSDLAHLLQTKQGNKETTQKIIQNLFPQKKTHFFSPDNNQQKRNLQMVQKEPKERNQTKNLVIAQSLDLSGQVKIPREHKRVFSFQKSNSGFNEIPFVQVKESNFFDKKDFLTAQNFNPFQKRNASLVKNPLNYLNKKDQEAQLRLRSKWQELDQYQLIKTKVYKHLQNPQTLFAQNYNDLYQSSVDQLQNKRAQRLLIDESILQSNDSSNFTSNVLDTDRFISRKLQQGSLTTGTSDNTKNIIIESINIQNANSQEDQYDVDCADETLQQDLLSFQNQLVTDQHEYLSYKIDEGRQTVFSQQNSIQKPQNDNEFHYQNHNFQTKIDGLKNLRKSMIVPHVGHLSKISHHQPINKMEMMSQTTTGRTAFSSNQPGLSSQNEYHLVEFKQKVKKLNLDIDQAEINLQNKTDFLQKAEKKLNKKIGNLQNSNEIQDPRNKIHQEILMKEKSQTSMKYQMLQQRFEIYLKKLKEFEGILPKDKEKKSHNPATVQSQFGQFQTFLTRLRIGLEEGCSLILKTLYQQQSEADQRAERSQRDYTKLYDQLIDFKAKNNLDEYFEKYLNDETRKNTVQLCQEVMKEDTSEWHDQLQTYKEYLNQFQYSDTKTNLQQNWKDLQEIQKGRLTIYTELDDQTEQVLHKAESNPPIPAQVFSAEYNKKLDELFGHSVYSTGKKVVQRLLQMYVKPTCEVGVNTESLKTLTVKYETRIAQQEDLLEKMRAEILQTTKDLNRFQKKNKDLIHSNNTLAEERLAEREEFEKMRESQSRRDAIEERLQGQVSILRESLENEKLAHMQSKQQYREIAGQLTQAKAQLQEQISFQKAQTLNNSEGLNQRMKFTLKINALQNMLQKVQIKLKEQNINVISEKDLHAMQELQRDPSSDQKDLGIKQSKQERNNQNINIYDDDDDQQQQTRNTEYVQQNYSATKNQEGNSIKPIIKQPTSKKTPFDENPPGKKKENQNENPQTKNIQFQLEKPTRNDQQLLNLNNSDDITKENQNSTKKSSLQQDSYNDLTGTINRKVEEPFPKKFQVPNKKNNKVSIQNELSNQTVVIKTEEQTVDEKSHDTSDKNLQSARQPKYAEIHQKATFINKKLQIDKTQQKSKKSANAQKSLDNKGIKKDNNQVPQLQLSSSVGSQKSLDNMRKKGDTSAFDQTQEDNTIQHDQISEEALSTNMQANFTTHKNNTDVTILGTKREKKNSPRFANKPKSDNSSPIHMQKLYYKQKKPLLFNQACQTQEIAYVHFACNMFLQEIQNLKEEIIWRDNEIQFQDLLGKASYIIQRIKTKAAGPNGVSGNGGMGVMQYKGMSPLNLGLLNQNVKEPRDKSWHFDVSYREKKQLAAGGGETQALTNRNKKSQRGESTRREMVLSGFGPRNQGPLTTSPNIDARRQTNQSQIFKYEALSTLRESETIKINVDDRDLENFHKILEEKNFGKLNDFAVSAQETYENRQNTRNHEDTQGAHTILKDNHEASSLNQESKFSKYRLLTPNEEEKVRRSVVEMFQNHVDQEHRLKSDNRLKRHQNVGTNDIDQKSNQKINDQEARQSVSTDQKLNQSIYNKN